MNDFVSTNEHAYHIQRVMIFRNEIDNRRRDLLTCTNGVFVIFELDDGVLMSFGVL
jgi:hypothetical protein